MAMWLRALAVLSETHVQFLVPTRHLTMIYGSNSGNLVPNPILHRNLAFTWCKDIIAYKIQSTQNKLIHIFKNIPVGEHAGKTTYPKHRKVCVVTYCTL